jgi:hypothetical protein
MQTKSAFVCLLDLLDVSKELFQDEQFTRMTKTVVENLLQKLLQLEWHRKAKFLMLQGLLERIEATEIFRHQQDFLVLLFCAMRSAGSFVKSFNRNELFFHFFSLVIRLCGFKRLHC